MVLWSSNEQKSWNEFGVNLLVIIEVEMRNHKIKRKIFVFRWTKRKKSLIWVWDFCSSVTVDALTWTQCHVYWCYNSAKFLPFAVVAMLKNTIMVKMLEIFVWISFASKRAGILGCSRQKNKPENGQKRTEDDIQIPLPGVLLPKVGTKVTGI